ncbi:MAG TPA: response regulator [Ktedonobacteraceae bacterium]|nr:response regulator [Ktedonobacteraceae bacterium]
MEKPLHRILIAEDEEIARRALCRVCEQSGCPVEVVFQAATGRQLLEALSKVQPDIILMDVVMPGMDGLAATRAAHELYPSTRVVIISAHDRFEYAQEALRAGAVDYLLKPVRAEQLVTLLKKLCAELDAENTNKMSAAALQEEKVEVQQARSPHYATMKRAEAYIAENFARSLTLEQVASHVDMAPTYFSRIFKQEQGCTFIAYLTRVRLEQARRLLRTTTLSVAKIGHAVGYQGPNYLAEVFKTSEGITPGAYRRNHSG